ncbi:hypothetical protein, partial [Paracoccus sp. SY]|uniref:hypothetical protein n=1 Tax=Paracoccus sp. SY TaxID=1330255 RepID=UPI0019619BAA
MVLTDFGYDQHRAERTLEHPAETPGTANGRNVATSRNRNCTGNAAFPTPISERPRNEAGPTHALTATPCHREDGLRAGKEGKGHIMKILMV